MKIDIAARPLLFESLEAPLAPLERLPRSLWLGGMTHSQGTLVPRLAALEAWRAALLVGGLPEAASTGWPPEALGLRVQALFAELELPRYCGGNPELGDTVLQGVLFHLDLIVDYIDRGASADEAVEMALAAFRSDWSERCGEMDALIEVFGDLGDLLKNTRWDLLRGLLRSSGWQEVVRIRRLLEQMPALVRVIRQLGRERPIEVLDEASQCTAAVMEEALALRARTRSVHVPDLPGQTRGVHRSGRIARMLPAEAMMLAHPRLRLVWHARHAERALLAYEDDDRMEEVRQAHAPVLRPTPRRAPERRMEMGAMLVCVDTSGSMQGGAEAVAKAVVLEAARAAHAQRRPCHVFAFSGPDEVVDLELGADLGGLERLTQFLGQTFSGGTDICGPLERALGRLDDEGWQLADLLIASDGEFGATPALAGRVARARTEAGLRVQGILIGDRETIGLHELATDILWVRDWRRFGQGDGCSPVHSSRLTADYFPGALRTPENRDATVSGGEASAALRAGRREKGGIANLYRSAGREANAPEGASDGATSAASDGAARGASGQDDGPRTD